MFDYLNYKNRIPLDKCIIPIPKLNPLSMQYEKFWIHNMKRKQIEGMWVEHNKEHKWIPGPLVQYTSLWTIEMSEKGSKSKGKSLGRPRLRDIEWIKGYVHATARGFSGFEGDEQFSCHRALLSLDEEGMLESLDEPTLQSIQNKKGEFKTYVPALEYLYEYKTKNLGKPLYLNEAKNVVDIECRNIGKTMISGSFCGHNFLTDGVMDFDEWLDKYYTKNEYDPTRKKFTTQTLVGASDSKYSSNLCKKIEVALDNLPGGVDVGGTYYPAPLGKMMSGSWTPGKGKIAEYQKKEGGKMKTKGTGSGFLHRTFKDNEFAANGTRYGFGIIDEVGFMGNLLATLGQLHECTTVDGFKYGTIWMTGTGGDMDGGATEAVKKVFYSPDSFDCLMFDDIFENTGKMIGFFVPGWMALDEFRDEFGNVNRVLAERKLKKERERASKASTKEALNDLLQMKPLVPSEAFLVSTGSVFPVADLMMQLKHVESLDDDNTLGIPGRMVIAPSGLVEFVPDLGLRNKILDYPIEKGKNNEGAIVIWEMPTKDPGYGYYVAGADPYNKDQALTSESVGSMFIIKRAGIGISPLDIIVAEYTGRPPRADDFYEQCRRLLAFYNGLCLFENNFPAMKTHFQYKNSLHHLAFSPTALKANKDGGNDRIYGLTMNKFVKDELEIYLRDWLTTKVDGEKMNLNFIYSKGLLKELISYNEEGNFDRVISLMLAVAQIIQMRKIVSETKKEIKTDPFFAKKLFLKRR